MSDGFLHIPVLLRPDELDRIEALAAEADFIDGKTTASWPASDVKNNHQVEAGSEPLQAIQTILSNALSSSPLFGVAAMPKRVYPFVVSKYGPGDHYGWHVDSPMMGDPPLRTDLAMTIFLSDPQSYQGGELIIQAGNGQSGFKPARGDAIVYPCQYLHCVNQVSEGTRLAAVTWIESNVKNVEQRQMLFTLNQIYGSLLHRLPDAHETTMLMQVHSNLVRMWAD